MIEGASDDEAGPAVTNEAPATKSTKGTTAKAGGGGSTNAAKEGEAGVGKAKKSTKKTHATGKKVVDTSWKERVTVNLNNTHYPVCK